MRISVVSKQIGALKKHQADLLFLLKEMGVRVIS